MLQHLSIATLVAVTTALDNGVGKLPAMGYDTFNGFGCNYNGTSSLEQAKLMKTLGLVKAGYNSFILDDCYTQKKRGRNGELLEDLVKFPMGMKAWTNTINSYGISGSAYSSNGYYTCGGYPAAYGHEEQDLETFRSWGWNYIKYDNCYIPYDNITHEGEYGRYERMAKAIAKVAAKHNEKPFLYSLCNWGWNQVNVWGPKMAQSWRINGDIKPFWSYIAAIINEAAFVADTANFFQHNDLDILEIGNVGRGEPPGNLTYEESKSHFTAWALLKSPLIIGTDLRLLSKEDLSILTNKDLIKINQDPKYGESITPFRWGTFADYQSSPYYPPQYWSGMSSWGSVFMILNTLDVAQNMTFDLTESWTIRAGRQYKVRDMWLQKDMGIAVRNWTVSLPAHGVAALLLTDAGNEPKSATVDLPCAAPLLQYQCSNPQGQYIKNGTLNGGWCGVGGCLPPA